MPPIPVSAEEQLLRLKSQIVWVTRITTGLSSANNLDDLFSIIMAALISPTGLSFSRAMLFQWDEREEALRGRYALMHDSSESMGEFAREIEDEAKYFDRRNGDANTSVPGEKEITSLQAGIPWVMLFQRLNSENNISGEIQHITLPLRRPEDVGSIQQIAADSRDPRCASRSALHGKIPAALEALLPENFCFMPLQTHKGMRALLFVDRHLEGDGPPSEDDIHELDWFMRQSALALENVEARLDLANAYQELKQLDQMKSNFLSVISHELRTPLTSMNGFVELILEERVGSINENQRQLLSRVTKNTAHLIHLVNDLIEVAEIEAEGTVEVQLGPVEPLAVLLNTLPRLEQRRRGHDVSIEPIVEGEIPRVLCDERALERVFFHLLDNAVKFSQASSTVSVRFRVVEGNLHVDFCDVGSGIAKENLDNIFKQFYQVDNTLTRGHEGLGLGLAVTKMLINATHGQIRVSSRVGEGSTFSVIYPVYVERDADSF